MVFQHVFHYLHRLAADLLRLQHIQLLGHSIDLAKTVPDDAKFKAEVTNNALDSSPVWQDATTEVQNGVNIVFENKTATAGAAFNFRVSAERGESGEGGYIEAAVQSSIVQ